MKTEGRVSSPARPARPMAGGRSARAPVRLQGGLCVEGKLWIGLAFACATALATNLAFLWKHRGAVAAPGIDMHRPVKSATALFRSKWWTIGWAVAVLGWAFHVGALAFAPLSLAQAVISGGFVVLAVLGERLFGFKLGRRQWMGIALVAVGLGVLGATTAGLLLATAAGLAFGLSDVSIKALAEQTLGQPLAVISPWTATALIASVGAFY